MSFNFAVLLQITVPAIILVGWFRIWAAMVNHKFIDFSQVYWGVSLGMLVASWVNAAHYLERSIIAGFSDFGVSFFWWAFLFGLILELSTIKVSFWYKRFLQAISIASLVLSLKLFGLFPFGPLSGNISFGWQLNLFFSALTISVFSDLKDYTIPRAASSLLVPVWLCLAYFELLPIDFFDSLLGLAFGFGVPWISAKIIKLIRNVDALGFGDIELFAMIGAFVGPVVLDIFILANFLGLLGFGFLAATRGRKAIGDYLPFAPFIAVAVLFQMLFKFTFF